MDMFPHFWIRRPSTFGKYSIFHPLQGLSADNFTSKNVILFIFSNFLFIANYLNLLFNFEIGPSSGISCLMSSMFIIILIIRIIKTTYFDNNILMVELERKLP